MSNLLHDKRVLIVGDGIGIPDGLAPTQRLTMLARALKCSGLNVEIVISSPSEFPGGIERNANAKGLVCDIPYHYAGNRTRYSSSFLARRAQSVLGILLTVRLLNKGNFDAVLAYVRKPHLLLALRVASLLRKTRLVLELCEWPENLSSNKWDVRLSNLIFTRSQQLMCDGIVCITSEIQSRLDRQAKSLKITPKETLVVPILSDPREFEEVRECRSDKKYIMFAGSQHYWDTLQLIVEAFAILLREDRCSEVSLRISGIPDNSATASRLRDLARELRVHERVEILGFVPRQVLLQHYHGAAALMVPLIDDEASQTRFPTKLAEYLLAGVPVVTTNVGIVSAVLKNKISGYIALGTDKEALANAAIDALTDSNAPEVAAEGKRVAQEAFDYRNHSQSLSRFLIQPTSND